MEHIASSSFGVIRFLCYFIYNSFSACCLYLPGTKTACLHFLCVKNFFKTCLRELMKETADVVKLLGKKLFASRLVVHVRERPFFCSFKSS